MILITKIYFTAKEKVIEVQADGKISDVDCCRIPINMNISICKEKSPRGELRTGRPGEVQQTQSCSTIQTSNALYYEV